jgi:nitrite reductase (NADH) small subunit/3-phenylpropionate/trans-cinnamate dioxygenase ferredoxin subunit
MSGFQKVCDVGDVPEGTGRLFVVGDRQVGVFHVQGRFFALDNRCPHAGASLASGLIEDQTVYCRIHYWQFRLCDGQRLDEDRPGTSARSFAVRVVGEEVFVDLADGALPRP